MHPQKILSTLLLFLASSPALAADCQIPTSGVWELDEDHFVEQLSKGDPDIAGQIREHFFVRSEPSTWRFDNNEAIFRASGYDQRVLLETTEGCSVLATVINNADVANGHSEEIAFESSENRICFTYPREGEDTLVECYLRREDQQ